MINFLKAVGFRLWIKNNRKKILRYGSFTVLIGLIGYILYFYLSLPNVEYLKTENPRITSFMEFRQKQAEAVPKKYKIRQYWVPFNAIPEQLKNAVRISEDAAFYAHEGVDYEELKESIKKNWEQGRFARGGSTITQQLAKNLYLSPQKDLRRKIREYFITRRLESTLSKNRIYHLYLNVIELGPGIFGMEAAARYYFDKSVSELNFEEMIRLTAVIPKPLLENPTRTSRWLKWKCKWILDKMKLYKYIDDDTYETTITAFK